jgi:hypothetical protein
MYRRPAERCIYRVDAIKILREAATKIIAIRRAVIGGKLAKSCSVIVVKRLDQCRAPPVFFRLS